MKEYETLYILLPDLGTDKVEEVGRKLADAIKARKGEVLTDFNWGKRKLAYPIEKNGNGIYIYLNYLGEGDLVAEVERLLKYDDNVLRYITVKLEDAVDATKRSQEKREFTLTSYEDHVERQGPHVPYGSHAPAPQPFNQN